MTDISTRYPQDACPERSPWENQRSGRGVCGGFEVEHVQRLVYYSDADRHQQHDPFEFI